MGGWFVCVGRGVGWGGCLCVRGVGQWLEIVGATRAGIGPRAVLVARPGRCAHTRRRRAAIPPRARLFCAGVRGVRFRGARGEMGTVQGAEPLTDCWACRARCAVATQWQQHRTRRSVKWGRCAWAGSRPQRVAAAVCQAACPPPPRCRNRSGRPA